MGYVFEWDHRKAKLNVQKHDVTFDEASTAFGDPLALSCETRIIPLMKSDTLFLECLIGTGYW